ncbi:MAG: fibrobacter succinogenes major paralogous domain-containing protein [Fibrobacter sp.]|nr:fibrobacter succinogenes major paralogous domain-containing protein [Fibrobacter sp.]
MKNAMKIVLVGVMALFCVNEAMAGTFRDPRDGKTYKTVKMPDGETWMAENLNYNMNGSMCYDNDATNCSKYGRLYTWEDAQEACPSGWHLPSRGEFRNLLGAVGGDEPKKLRARSWVSEEQVCEQYGCSYGNGSTIRECRGNNRCNCGQGESICMEYGVKEVRGEGTFSALPAGRYYSNNKKFLNLGSYAYFWSSTGYNDDDAYYLSINEGYALVNYLDKTNGFSVRCLQD